MQIRPFLNSDPPGIANVWRQQSPMRGLTQPMSSAILDRFVFSKPYFDRHGLMVAEDEGEIIGFAHAGFGPNENASDVDRSQGVVCLVMVAHRDDAKSIADALLAASENWLRESGAEKIYGGAASPVDPFYLGLYGGADLSGVLASDTVATEMFQRAGYEPVRTTLVMQRDLTSFRPPVNRTQMQLRRQYNIEPVLDPPISNWWEACTIGQTDRTQFVVRPRSGGIAIAHATFWDMEPMASSWGVHAIGLTETHFAEGQSMDELGQFLLGESLRQLNSHGITLAETHITEEDPACALYKQMGFETVDQGVQFSKPQ